MKQLLTLILFSFCVLNTQSQTYTCSTIVHDTIAIFDIESTGKTFHDSTYYKRNWYGKKKTVTTTVYHDTTLYYSAEQTFQTSHDTCIAITQTAFGILPFDCRDTTSKINAAKNCGVNIIRIGADISGAGIGSGYNTYTNAGMKVIYSLTWGTSTTGPRPFPTDLILYKQKLTSVLSALNPKPEVVVIENEPTNLSYYSTDVSNYINELKVAIDVCHSFGIKVADGGLHPQGLNYLAYFDYHDRGLPDSALYMLNFFTKKMSDYYKNPAANQDFGNYLSACLTLISAYKDLPLDYVNIHFYEPTSFGMYGATASDYAPMINYYRNATGKPVISNEFGISVNSNALLQSVIMGIKKCGLLYAIFFSGTSTGTLPIVDASGNANSLGVFFNSSIK